MWFLLKTPRDLERMEGLCSIPFISTWAPKMQTKQWHQLRRHRIMVVIRLPNH
jgi:hypothetical protein